jgi:hypothetical protein
MDQGFTVVLVSIRPDGNSFGRCSHTPVGDAAVESERQRENIVAMGGWAAELASGEAADGMTYDSSDMSWLLSRAHQHAPSRIAAELGWAETEAERIVSANIDKVRRLADELLKRQEISGADEILAIVEA